MLTDPRNRAPLKCLVGETTTGLTPRKFRFDYCDGPLPYPPGQSSFRIKGEFYRQSVAFLEYHAKKSEGRLQEILKREGLYDFSQQAFLASSFYDVLPLPRMVMAVAEARDRDVRELTSYMGHGSVLGQLKGVYGPILNALTPQNFCQRYEHVINHFYDFAPMRVTQVPGGADIVRSGMPLCAAEWWSLVTAPFMSVPLEAGGATEVQVVSRIEPGPELSGVRCGSVYTQLRWREGPAGARR